jgi:hypothetical protein
LESTRSIAVVGLRTLPRHGWRADLEVALAFVRRRPDAWLLGALGFSLRGGIALLTLPIIVLPTQVEARQLLGSGLSSSGLTQGFWQGVVVATVITVAVLLGIFYVLARTELGLFERLVADSASEPGPATQARRQLTRGGRAGLLARLFVVQAVGALALLMSAVPAAVAMGDAAYAELLAPTSAESIFVRIYGHVVDELFVAIIALGIVELVTAAASRALMTDAYGLAQGARRGGMLARTFAGSARALLLHPLRTAVNAALGWALTLVAALTGLWLIGPAWQTTRSVFLAAPASGAAQLAALLAVAALLAIVFATAIAVLGLVSTFRASLGSLASLR